MGRITGVLCSFVLAASLLAGCQKEPQAPQAAASADQAGYAERFPARLGARAGSIGESEAQAQQLAAAFAQYPDSLKEPDWNQVRDVYSLADRSGRSGAFAQGARESATVQAFYEEEKPNLHKRVGGGVKYAAQQKQCDADVYGAAVHSMDKAMEKSLQERLRTYGEAHRYLEDNEESLGKANTETLATQADEIALAAYQVHVAMPAAEYELRGMVDEAQQVRKTLEREVEQQDAITKDLDATEGRKRKAQERSSAAMRAITELDTHLQSLEQEKAKMPDRIKAAQEAYDQAFKALIEEVEKRISGSGVG